MADDEEAGLEVIWTVPPEVTPDERAGDHDPKREIERLAEALEKACRPEGVTLEVIPHGVSHIDLQFPDREAAVGALDAVRDRVRAHPELACRVVATVVRS